jgi:hypothetical protein
MKEIQPLSQDKIVIEKQAEQEKQNKLVGRIIPKKGHIIFEVNLKNGDVNEAEFEKLLLLEEIKRPKKKIQVNKDCIYVSALNLKNLKKKLLGAGIIK